MSLPPEKLLLTQDEERLGKPARALDKRPSPIVSALQALRPGQWVKNLLVFVPLVASHQVMFLDKAAALALAFLAFCACSSSVYVVNDLLDLEADRRHPIKRHRPFASGALPIVVGPFLVCVLYTLTFGISLAALPLSFSGLLVLYIVANYLYSGLLKEIVILDVLILAGLYAVRVLAGGVAVDIPVSEWLLAFSMFFFTSLAFAKRYAELDRLALSQDGATQTRGYLVSDLRLIESIGPCSGYLAVLVFSLYINTEDMKKLYTNNVPLWLFCPLLLYWISRIWLMARRGVLSEDPIVFAIKDRASILIGVLGILLLVIASA